MPTAIRRCVAFVILFACTSRGALAQASLQPPTRIATVPLRNFRDEVEGAISPDGRSFVFERGEGEQRSLWLLDVTSGTTRLLTPRAGARHNAVWSNDGRQLAYSADLKLPGYADALKGIWVLDLVDGRERLVHGTSRYDMVWEASWTPDRRLVFVDWAGGRGGVAPVQSVDPRTGAVTEITRDTMAVESPQVSPDGRSLAFFGAPCADSTRRGLRVLPLGGQRRAASRCLVDMAPGAGSPLWSPDGRTLYSLERPHKDSLPRVVAVDVAHGVRQIVDTRGVNGEIRRISITRDSRLTLAVTHVDAPPTVWQMRPTGVMSAPPAERAAIADVAPRTRTSADPNVFLADLASRIAAGHAALERVWPGFWPDTQSYLLDAPTLPGALLVAPEAPIVGFRQVSLVHPPTVPLRAFWNPGRPANAESMPLPRSSIAALPRPGASESERVAWRERVLFDLFYGDTTLMSAFATDRAWDAGLLDRKEQPVRLELCVTGLASACGAMRQLERRVLSAALAAPPRELTAAVRRYVAVRWIRRATRGDGSGEWERFIGARSYAARRAAIALSGGDTTRYATDVVRAFNGLADSDTGEFEVRERRAAATGQALAVLLDRLGVEWKRNLYRGDDFLALLARAVRFDSTRALRLAKPAYSRFGLPALLHRALTAADTTVERRRELATANYNQHFYYYLLGKALGPDSAALAIYLPNKPDWSVDTTRYHIRYVPGAGDTASAPDGMVFLPAPDSFVLEAPDLRVEVRGVPVFVDTRPATFRRTSVVLFLPDSVLSRLRVQNGWDSNRATRTIGVPPPGSQGQRIRGPGYDLRIGPGMIVERPNMIPASIVVTEPSPRRR